MKPEKTGSPVPKTYRMTSVLKIVCRVTAAAVIHNNESPYRTNTAGPSRNSPLPIDAPSTITPGPTTPSHLNPVGVGGAGISAGRQGSRPERASGAVTVPGGDERRSIGLAMIGVFVLPESEHSAGGLNARLRAARRRRDRRANGWARAGAGGVSMRASLAGGR
jgi:hypothetical protein